VGTVFRLAALVYARAFLAFLFDLAVPALPRAGTLFQVLALLRNDSTGLGLNRGSVE
jgi:hypothetical protein